MTTKIIKKDNPALSITKTYDITKPVEAVQMAVLLKNIVVSQKLYANIKGKNYAMVEGWMLAGMLTGIDVIVDEPKCLSNDKEVKYSAMARLYKGDKVIGAGFAICSSKEAIKKGFEEYAIYSMCQTRAISRAYRNKIGFIMKLAGFQPTPSEEMTRVGEVVPDVPENVTTGQTTAKDEAPKVYAPTKLAVCNGLTKSGCGNDLKEAERAFSKKMFGKELCRDCQKHANPIRK